MTMQEVVREFDEAALAVCFKCSLKIFKENSKELAPCHKDCKIKSAVAAVTKKIKEEF